MGGRDVVIKVERERLWSLVPKNLARFPYGVARARLGDYLEVWAWSETHGVRLEARMFHSVLVGRDPDSSERRVLLADTDPEVRTDPLWDVLRVTRVPVVWERVTAQEVDTLDDADSVWERLGGRLE